MTLLGLDFDNTLVRYDKLFHKLALEKNLIEQEIPANKQQFVITYASKVKKKNSRFYKVKFTGQEFWKQNPQKECYKL